MKFFLHTCVLLSFVGCAWTYIIPDATVEILKPKGFRLSIPNEEGITDVSFNIKIDQRISLYQPGDFAAIIKEPTNDRWAFDNINTRVKAGSVINYWIHVQFGMLGKNFRDTGTAVVSANSVEISSSCLESTDPSCPQTGKTNCEASTTTVGGKSACKGELIFEDTFDSLDWNKWDREVRMPLAEDDGQFVSFQNLPDNCYVDNGQMHIIPSLLSETPGYDLSKIRSGKLDLGQQCTAVLDRAQECKRQARYYQILPPVVSARIRTKNSFTFRYGKVEIKAILPKGDWLFPLILLEPLENYYGVTGYASGQMRIAFNRGNEILVDKSRKDISSKFLYGGVVMTYGENLRGTHLRTVNTQSDLSSQFHIYTLTWTENRITMAVDGVEFVDLNDNYSQLQKKYHGHTNSAHKMAPFDREFFLTLGVSAGGHSDFPDECRSGVEGLLKPWRNGEPKAELFFWKDRDNWSKSWNKKTSGLHVDYVKVYAL